MGGYFAIFAAYGGDPTLSHGYSTAYKPSNYTYQPIHINLYISTLAEFGQQQRLSSN